MFCIPKNIFLIKEQVFLFYLIFFQHRYFYYKKFKKKYALTDINQHNN